MISSSFINKENKKVSKRSGGNKGDRLVLVETQSETETETNKDTEAGETKREKKWVMYGSVSARE